MIFQRENLDAFKCEMTPLLAAHFEEVKHEFGVLSPDWERYSMFEQLGAYVAFTAREDAALVGYAGFFINNATHNASTITADCDLIYMAPEHRGMGAQFIAWCDEQLKLENVKFVYQHVPVTRDFTRVLNRLGYLPTEQIFVRKLGE